MKTQPPVGVWVYSLLLALFETAHAQYPQWQHSGPLYILTTPEGANLPATTAENDFPLLVRLHRDWFDFSQAETNGADIRFSAEGKPLSFQVEEWDAANGAASIWVRIPVIKGHARQEIKLHWGKAAATSESSGSAVFNESNGYLSVWHMNDPLKDTVGTLESKNRGTTLCAGLIGQGRHFEAGQGINCGEKNPTYPAGSNPHSTEVWFRAEKPNTTLVAWGNEEAQGKVVMQFVSPPHLNMDCYFSGGNVASQGMLPLSQWVHAVHTYEKGNSRIYLNGVLAGANTSAGSPLAIKNPARMYVGGWYEHYTFVGDMDEVRISKVARSAGWVKLQYENQKPLQTLVGPVVQPGTAFSVSPPQLTVAEGKSATISARAEGAQKVYWILQSEGQETVVAVDRFSHTFNAGRVTGHQSLVLQLRAIYAQETKTLDVPITITEQIPEPVFALKAPATWDGRKTIEVVPLIANLAEMQAKGAGDLRYAWRVSGLAVIKEIAPGKLTLQRAQKSGRLTVALALSNGGTPTTGETTLNVEEPEKDPWVQRTPAPDEKPEDNQFYARDDGNEGTLYYSGTLDQAADTVFLRLYADDQLIRNESRKLPANRAYAFSARLKPGLTRYRVEFGCGSGTQERILHTATNLVCGDAYLIDGQSNALATDTSETAPPDTSDWIRTYGSTAGDSHAARLKLWGNAVWKDRRGEKLQLGYWGMELAKRLVESQRMPICIINGAVGGSRIDQHQRNPANPEDVSTIYGRLLWRVWQARLTHGIRGILWHQGENDQGADGPTGGFGWETYQQYFMEMSAGWKQDYPNLQHYYVFQIWPRACAMGVNGSDDMLREVQRTLPALYSHLSVMSTLGIKPPGGCHYPLAGWAEFARLIQPLIERDIYGKVFPDSITPPNLIKAGYTSDRRDEITLRFDQPVVWTESLASQFYLDGAKDQVASGSVSGSVVTLRLNAASSARHITYLDSRSWKETNLLYGANGLAALTFCNVPISTK
jgi:hypothetical protein